MATYEIIRSDELMHYGVLGMKWGVRNYQNKDGSLTEKGKKRYAKSIKKMEKKAISKEYKSRKASGESIPLPFYRYSTGENYNRVQNEYDKKMKTDEEYKRLSKKAFDAEKKRLMAEKGYVDDDEKYEQLYRDKKYLKLLEESENATKAKDRRKRQIAKEYIDEIKEAKLNDLNIIENRELAKQYISSKFDDYYWDENLEYNPDSYYDKWVEKTKFK